MRLRAPIVHLHVLRSIVYPFCLFDLFVDVTCRLRQSNLVLEWSQLCDVACWVRIGHTNLQCVAVSGSHRTERAHWYCDDLIVLMSMSERVCFINVLIKF